MLQAKTQKGKIVTLATYSLHDINLLRKQQSFYCPTCHEQVIPRAGPHTIPHFAHQSKSQCDSVLGGEGPYHEKGKLFLYQWLVQQNIKVSLEKYLPNIQRRPDIYIELYNKKIVIEFQCAKVSVKEIQQRNKDFKKVGIIPIWILGAKLLQRTDHNQVKLSAFTTQFLHRFTTSTLSYLYYFCPQYKQFIIASDLLYLTKDEAIASIYIAKLHTISFKHLFRTQRLNHKEILHVWQRAKYQFRTSQYQARYGREMTWYQWLYSKKTHKHYLPTEIYLPVRGQHLMKSSLWDWQSRICLDIIDSLQISETFSIHQCYKLLHSHLHSHHHFPLISSHLHPIQYYLNWLERLLIIEKVSSGWYKKIANFTFYNHIEKAIKADNKLFISKNE